MKKLIMSAVMCFALVASASVMAQDTKECTKTKTECTKGEKKACTKGEKKECTKTKTECTKGEKKACCKNKK